MQTKTFSVPALVSLTSGRLLCNFGEMHEAAEYLMGHSIWTHEFASKPLWDLMKSKLLEQHPDLDIAEDAYTDKTWEAFRDELIATLGETREIARGDEVRAADPVTTARSMLGPDKPIIAVRTGRGREQE